jgi:hypothetical protein
MRWLKWSLGWVALVAGIGRILDFMLTPSNYSANSVDDLIPVSPFPPDCVVLVEDKRFSVNKAVGFASGAGEW